MLVVVLGIRGSLPFVPALKYESTVIAAVTQPLSPSLGESKKSLLLSFYGKVGGLGAVSCGSEDHQACNQRTSSGMCNAATHRRHAWMRCGALTMRGLFGSLVIQLRIFFSSTI